VNNISSLQKVLFKIKKWKKKQKEIVLTNGCFDLLHPGHKYLFRQAKKKNQKLIVLINSDTSVRNLKGNKRPIENQTLRKKKIDRIKYVDFSIIFAEKTPLKLIKLIKPNIIVKGEDYKNKNISGANYIKKYGGKVKLVKLYGSYSTTKKIKQKKYDKKINI